MKKFMNKLKNKRYTISLLVTVLGLIGLISGTSYAILKGSTSASSEQVIKSGSVELKLTENFNSIDTGVSTMSDVDGLLQEDVYNFTVTNIGTVSAKYDLKLINEAPSGQTALSDEYVRLGLEVNGQEMGPMGLTKVNNIIDSSTIAEGEIIRYKLRVWFDSSKTSELTGNTNKAYLKLKVEAKQAEYKEYQPEPGATVLYSDGTLIINEPTSKREANIQTHGAVSKEYPEMKSEGTDIEKYKFASEADQLWASDRSTITSVEIGQKIRPTSTAYWFSGLRNMTTGDFTNLDTKNITDMSGMFREAGFNSSVTSFTLTGLNNWDTSSVTNMGAMFQYVGRNATTWNIGDLSSWNTSKVTDMTYMFNGTGLFATTWDIGDLSGWDTSSVTSMNHMFHSAGYRATTWSIGNLSNWDTSKVTDMSGMFAVTGENTTTWDIGDLSNWNTSSVTNMSDMFHSAGSHATTWNNIGTLKVYAINTSNMFLNCSNAKATLNIYSNPTTYSHAFNGAATASGALITVNYKSTTTNIDNIIATKSDDSNVVKGSVIS